MTVRNVNKADQGIYWLCLDVAGKDPCERITIRVQEPPVNEPETTFNLQDQIVT